MKNIIERLAGRLSKMGLGHVRVSEEDGSLRLQGSVRTYDDLVRAGYAAAALPCREVINDIAVEGAVPEDERLPDVSDSVLEGRHFDCLVIGGGVIGCAILRELKRWNVSAALVEKEADLATHASGRNDGMIHPGFAAHPGTKKAYYNVRGNRAYDRVAEDLGLNFERTGSLLLLRSPLHILIVPYFFIRARQNGVPGCRFFSRRRVFRMEPWMTRKQWGAFYFSTTGEMSPYLATIACAENAVENGAEVFLNTRVSGMDRETGKDGRSRIAAVHTNRGSCTADVVINAAGAWADRIAGYAGDRFYSLHFRKGVDCILDKKTGARQHSASGMPALLQLKSKTKGGGIIPTVEGNLLIGPTAVEVPDREGYATDPGDIAELQKHINLNRALKKGDIITYFAGVRACSWKEDFIIEASKRVENLVHVAGIQSPGFASAPAIAEDVVSFSLEIMKQQGREVGRNDGFNPRRKPPVDTSRMTDKEKSDCIAADPAYGRIICRCEEISEGEIRDALRSVIPVTTVDGIKRRTRSGMGRCHGGFCTPRILEIMADELALPMERISKKGGGSVYFTGETKG